VLYGFSVASAGTGALISLPQLIGALGGAPGALAVDTVLQNLAVNFGAVGLFGFLFSKDWQVGGGGLGSIWGVGAREGWVGGRQRCDDVMWDARVQQHIACAAEVSTVLLCMLASPVPCLAPLSHALRNFFGVWE
jgi:hypothetical protein